MPTYDEILKRMKQPRRLVQPDEIEGVKQEIACMCPNCDHKFQVIIVLKEMRIDLFAPRYDKKAG